MSGPPASETGSGTRRDDPFTRAIQLLDTDIDEQGHVNNVVYVRWMQDIAAAHWEAHASVEEFAAISWVAVRHEIDYHQAALPGDALQARTWVGTADAVRFERFVEIVRTRDQRVLTSARTLWCPVRRDTGRITRVSAALRSRFSNESSAR